MDVDSDIDQTLLQQFSCMGTTDRDELVKQLQSLIGNLNETAAVFFLEMNNWNLQEAVCSYFDFESPYKLPSMSLVRDVTVGEGESIPPLTKFTKSWRVQNTGTEMWPDGCSLRFSGGDRLCAPERLAVAPIAPGCTLDISLEMVSPEQTGMYESKWRMVTPAGCYFGDVIWVIVTVAEGGTMALTQQLSHLNDLGSPLRQVNHSSLNPFGPSPTQTLFQDSVQQTQDGDTNMMC
ncbi:protein ILRUN [Schistocerca americana]|uniref:protein ILRUN n=1 Tax=Schistocerca americana TaxID=7009 RepID=UPI001F4F344B|nr:protein ILRUN [Schistocerca americana]XP_047120901.1 protein ILRUN [Schistocerca piceifrons]XP_049765125.1 protein ILRUN [Schistocerca cancellata]XP_049791452.1 protein ILRUN [Schistocerca nitens]XP_049836067.1 protein ILRUN [Schistocerca gregaria]XP_049938077.1 protein ILRUN [Schistocerca serialis cubense]